MLNIQRLAICTQLLMGAGCSGVQAGSSAVPPRHVFLIVMENHSAAEALCGPFAASLAARYGVAADYHAVAHPSVPNYLALTSGQTWGSVDDSYRVLPKSDLGDQLSAAGVSWKAYMEGLGPQGCLDSPVPYDAGHNPFAFYGGACPANVVPLAAQAADLGGRRRGSAGSRPIAATTATTARWPRATRGYARRSARSLRPGRGAPTACSSSPGTRTTTAPTTTS